MKLEHAVIHRIRKERGQSSHLHLREQKLDTASPPLERLIDEIRGIYEKTGKSRGIFERDLISYPFQGMIKRFLEGTDDFIKFTKDGMSFLQKTIDRETLATGGYLLFALYREEPNRFLMVVMLNDVTGTTVEEDNLDVKDIHHLDTKHLHLAARVNITFWQSRQAEQYLSFVKGKGSGDVSRYFLEFLGCKDFNNSKDQTKKLRDAVEAFCVERNMDQTQKRELKQKIFNHCEEKRKNKLPISLEALSCVVDEDNPSAFLVFANSEKMGVDSVFDPDREVLYSFRFVKLEKKGIKLSFDRDLLDKEVFLKDGSLLITKLSDDWISQLKE